MPQLWKISYSPWSAKASWALKHHHIEHSREEYLPLFGELLLRLKLGKTGAATVPVLFVDGGAISDSFGIAQYAEAHGCGAPLFPAADMGAIRRWNNCSEEVLSAGRVLATSRTLQSPAALAEALPGALAKLGPASVGLARQGARFLQFKYDFNIASFDAALATSRAGLERLRAGLDGNDYLLGAFSYADLAMAVGLQFIRPVAEPYLRMGEETRACWTSPALANDYADLLDWRDAIFGRHHPRSPTLC